MVGSNQVSNVASSVVTPVALSGFKTPLLNEFEGASAAYSLRRLKSWEDGSKVVRVRRATDNAEQDFSSVDVANGTMANWVNAYTDLPLDVDSGAAAAYSLRNLKASYTGNVVEVRRTSDDATQSFTAAEVADGTLESWVDADVVTYESDFSAGVDGWGSVNGTTDGNIDSIGGQDDNLRFTVDATTSTHQAQRILFTAGFEYTLSYDIYIPSSNVTLDNVRTSSSARFATKTTTKDTWVTQTIADTASTATLFFIAQDSGDNATFTGNGTDVFYIRNVVVTQTTADGHVKTWYDQSGNSRDLSQATAANQPKIVSAGALVTDAGDNAIQFDGTDDYFDLGSLVDFGNNASTFFVWRQDAVDAAVIHLTDNLAGSGSSQIDVRSTQVNWRIDGTNNFISGTTSMDNESLFTFIRPTSSTYSAWRNGASLGNYGSTATTNSSFRYLGSNPPAQLSGFYKELIIYNSDQTDNRIAIEANIGDYYSIDLPAGVDSGNNEVDGFVTKWYDQSGNGNDAVQTTAANQPKIVDAGALVTDAGDNAIQFDGTDDYFDIGSSVDFGNNASVFFVWRQDAVDAAVIHLTDNLAGSGSSQIDVRSTQVNWRIDGTNNFISGTTSMDNESLFTFIRPTSSTYSAWRNGASLGTNGSTATANSSFRYLGSNFAAQLSGFYKELIIYNSDQSANRTAIETNIADEYGITLS